MKGYRSGGSPGGKWGSIAAGLVGAPIFFLLILVDSLGGCDPDRECHKGFLTYVAVPTFAVALLVGLIVRMLVNRLERKGS
ncbi:hypothetical protein [Sphingomonas bacterium]|uniref:hypothetical protein n=1 Tax=Sphingomonas bacterium TaxID=1895847 RepID=UPI001C2D3B0E|nr:hypothetical protein [Sphingomonas bacterium]